MGKSGGGSGASKVLEGISKQVHEEATPVRREILDQVLEALRTGGTPSSRIPSVQRAVESAKSAQSQSIERINEMLASMSGVAGTPFAARTLAEAEQAGEYQISQIPTQAVEALASIAPNFALGFPQVATGGLANAASVQQTGKGQELSFLAALGQAAATAYACQVASVLFGDFHPKALRVRRYVLYNPDNLFVRLYKQHGARWANWIRDWPCLRLIAQPIWEYLAWQGGRY